MIYSTAIIGAGAAGLMAAGFTPSPTIIIDHGKQIGRKILISGGGKCNFSNRTIDRDHYLSSNPNFCRSALSHFTTDDFLALLEQESIGWEERPSGQLFAKDAEAIRNMLIRRAKRNGVKFQMQTEIESIDRNEMGFQIITSAGEICCTNLILATGGLSFPSLGATSFGHEVARQFSIPVVAPRPALVALNCDDGFRRRFSNLAGLSVGAAVRTDKYAFVGDLIFTHFGLSGPAILKTSLHWQKGGHLELDFLPDFSLADHFQSPKKLDELVGPYLPRRLLTTLVPNHARPMAALSKAEKRLIEQDLHHFQIVPTDTAGFDRAEVTAGGIDTRYLSSKTFEFRTVQNLYAIGEVLDVTGQLGGYNLHWAWASAAAAGRAIAAKVDR